jgi:hypothetical protein
MGWTEFHVIVDDDAEFIVCTTFNTEFFSMPSGYSASRIMRIRPGTKLARRNAIGFGRWHSLPVGYNPLAAQFRFS